MKIGFLLSVGLLFTCCSDEEMTDQLTGSWQSANPIEMTMTITKTDDRTYHVTDAFATLGAGRKALTAKVIEGDDGPTITRLYFLGDSFRLKIHNLHPSSSDPEQIIADAVDIIEGADSLRISELVFR